VSCSLHVVEGAFHGFDAIFSATNVSREFELAQTRALAQAFQHPGEALEPLPHP
jgi:hypothetical protein